MAFNNEGKENRKPLLQLRYDKGQLFIITGNVTLMHFAIIAITMLFLKLVHIVPQYNNIKQTQWDFNQLVQSYSKLNGRNLNKRDRLYQKQ